MWGPRTPILLWFMILITSQTMKNYGYRGLQPTGGEATLQPFSQLQAALAYRIEVI